jgi:hypothetical protein
MVRLLIGMVLVLITTAVLIGDWIYAMHQQGDKPHRLRRYVIAKTCLPIGTIITEDLIETRFGWLTDSISEAELISAPRNAIGKYALSTFKPGVRLTPTGIGIAPNLISDLSFLAVPVEIKNEYSVGLIPGMKLLFAKAGSTLPTPTGKDALSNGLPLLALVPTKSSTFAIVALGPKETTYVQKLAESGWVPIITGSPTDNRLSPCD